MSQEPSSAFMQLASYLSKDERKLLKKAYAFAADAHEGQLRKSGDPYLTHSAAAAEELMKMQMDVESVVAGLLHDVPEDTPLSLDDIRQEFGDDITKLVSGVTNLGRVRLRNAEERQAKNLRKMFLAMSKDVRVVIVKLCDRLHNMRTIEFLPQEKQYGNAKETLEIYAPLANRLGIWEIKWKLEDLSFKVLHPQIYDDIQRELQESYGERQDQIDEFIPRLESALEEAKIVGRVVGRVKHLYAIYENVYLKKKDNNISSVLDSKGVRVIVDSVHDCYQALGVVHRIWRPILGRFKDYIAIPKGNGYQSLHTGVITEDGQKIEVQIRTEEMNYLAEYGMAAHWKYKGDAQFDSRIEERMSWIQQLLDWQREFRTALDFVESLKLDLFEDQIFVFTPKGDIRELPANATPVDFAYATHTNVGHRCLGAKVNGRMVSLDYQLSNGDIVEILVSKQERGPSRDWLEFVRTNSARNKIRQWFKREHRDENVKFGREKLNSELNRLYHMHLDDVQQDVIDKLLEELNYQDFESLLAGVGYGALTVRQIVERLAGHKQEKTVPAHTPREPIQVGIKGAGDLLVKISPCCNPIPGDDIAGFITRGKGMTVHRATCHNIEQERLEEPERVIDLSWDEDRIESFQIDLLIRARDRVGLMKDMVNMLAERGYMIAGLESHSSSDKGTAEIRVSIKLNSIRDLSNLMRQLENIRDVVSVERFTT